MQMLTILPLQVMDTTNLPPGSKQPHSSLVLFLIFLLKHLERSQIIHFHLLIHQHLEDHGLEEF